MGMIVEALQPVSRREAPPAQRPIDLLHLARQAMGDPGLEIEILRMFDTTLSLHFAALERSVTVPELLRHLHVVNAASRGVGAWSLAEQARVMEDELKAGAAVNPERIDDIEMALEEVRTYIAERIAADDDSI